MLAAPEDNPAALARTVPLPRPQRGAATRVRIGRSELVLERTRGGEALLWSDGREARRYVLGLRATGRLSVELRAPQLPLQVVPREVLTLVPGGRLRGFVTVPLIPTVVFHEGPGARHELVTLHPAGLQAQWHEHVGHSYRCAASWLVRFPYASGEPQAVVPLRLVNHGDRVTCPGHLDLAFGDDDLHELRGALVLRPRRLTFGDAERRGARAEVDA